MNKNNSKLILGIPSREGMFEQIKAKFESKVVAIDWTRIISVYEEDNRQENLTENASRDCNSAMILNRSSKGIQCEIIKAKRNKLAHDKIVFMFPGIGDHYADMIASLYSHFSTYRLTIDFCFNYLNDKHDLDFFWTTQSQETGSASNSHQNDSFSSLLKQASANISSADDELKKTKYAHPFVFSHEYALASQLASWGINADLVLGYSLGEYVAATVAGALSLEATLDWVVERAFKVDELKRQTMLAIASNANECSEYLNDEIHIVALNSHINFIVAGDSVHIEALRQKLITLGISAMQVGVSHAFHTQYMAPVKIWAEKLCLVPESHPLVIDMITSTAVSHRKVGQLIEQSYWAEQLVNSINFQDSVDLLASEPYYFIEVGGGTALTTMLKQNKKYQRESWGRMMSPQARRSREKNGLIFFLKSVATMWSDGLIDTKKLAYNA